MDKEHLLPPPCLLFCFDLFCCWWQRPVAAVVLASPIPPSVLWEPLLLKCSVFLPGLLNESAWQNPPRIFFVRGHLCVRSLLGQSLHGEGWDPLWPDTPPSLGEACPGAQVARSGYRPTTWCLWICGGCPYQMQPCRRAHTGHARTRAVSGSGGPEPHTQLGGAMPPAKHTSSFPSDFCELIWL